MTEARRAFRDECARLGAVLRTLTPADLDRPTGCPPWTVAELVAHIRAGAGRLAGMLAAAVPGAALVDAAGYFGAAKFTPQVDTDRIGAARIEAARIHAVASETGAVLAAEFERAWRATLDAVDAHPPDRVVRTRHGDAMTATEFLRTRVVEVGVHGLDLAAALDRPPWLTPTAGRVIADLLTGGRTSTTALGWDELTLIRKATGREPISPVERDRLDRTGVTLLAFGR